MTTFLLTISLLLNGISIYFIMILYSRQNRLLEVEKTQDQLKKEIENEISAFLLEMKEENEDFIQRLQQMNKNSLQNNHSAVSKPEQPNESNQGEMIEPPHESDMKDWDIAAGQVFKKQAVKVYQKTIANQNVNKNADVDTVNQIENANDENLGNEEIYRNLLTSQVKILQNQGLSIDEIAKKLNKGKTEIDLLVKFG